MALFAAGLVVALLDTTIPVFVGRVVTMVSSRTPHAVLHDSWPQLLGMALVLLVARPAAMLVQNLITNQAIIPSFSNLDPLAKPLARGAAELDVLSERFRRPHRQPGHADRPGPARKRGLGDQRGLVHPGLRRRRDRCCWRRSDVRLAIPVLLWFCRLCGLAALVRARSCATARSGCPRRARSCPAGSSTAIPTSLTVKLFARPRDEDAFVREAMDELTDAHR